MRHLLLSGPPSSSIIHVSDIGESLGIAFGGAFCVVIIYLLIFSLQFCLRRVRNIEQPAADSDQKDDDSCLQQLQAIPVLVYDSKSHCPSEIEVCSICLAEYVDGEEVRVLIVCKHEFHKDCIDQWLLTRSSFCPICRHRVIERAVEPANTSCRGNNNDGNQGNFGGVIFDAGVINAQHLRALL